MFPERIPHPGGTVRRGAVAVVVALLVAALWPIAATPASATTTDLGLAEIWAFARDPLSGNLVVAGDDRLLVLDPSGSDIAEIEDLPAETTLHFAGTDLWLGALGTTSVSRIDTATWEVAETFELGGFQQGDLAVAGGALWAVTSDAWPTGTQTLRRLDPATGDVEARGTDVGADLHAVPGSDTEILTTRPLTRLDLTTDPVTVIDEATDPGPVDIAVAPAGDRLWGDDGIERSIPGLAPTGLHHAPGAGVAGPVHAPTADVLLSAGEGSLLVHQVGRPAATHRFDLPVVPGGLATAPDASAVYAITTTGSTTVLDVVDLTTTVSGVTPGTVVAGAATEVTLTGQGLGAVVVFVDATRVDHDVVSPTEVRVAVPALAEGPHTITVSGAFGNDAVEVTAAAAVPTTISGTIAWAYPGEVGGPLAGAEVTVDGPALAEPVQTTTDADGAYSLAGLPPTGRYVVTAVDPGGEHPRAQRGGVAPVSGATVDVDLVLGTQDLAAGPATGTWPVPPGSVQRLAIDPVSGRSVLVTRDVDRGGNGTLVVLDDDGTPVFEVDDLWSPSAPAIADGAAHVALADAGQVVVVDLTTGAAVRWALGRDLGPAIAVSGARAIVTDESDLASPTDAVDVLALDLGTGDLVDVTPEGTDATWLPTTIDGLPDRITMQTPTGDATVVFDASTTPLSPTATYPDAALAPRFADVATDRAWTSAGTELVLSTGEPTGDEYPTSCCGFGSSPGRGGTLWFGGNVFVAGDAAPTHQLTLPGPAPTPVVVSADADRVLTASTDGLTALSLAPTVLSVDAPAATTPRDLVVRGSGLRAATSVTIDGEPVTFTPGDGDALELAVPGLPLGVHDLAVTTAWGTSDVELASRPTAPLAPTEVAVDPGPGSVTVSWVAPDDGGAPIERFVARTSPGDRSCETTTETSCTIEGLRYGSPMTVTVVAVNGRGPGPAASSPPFTPDPLPAGYVPVAPVRVLDTRKPTPAPLGPREVVTVPVGTVIPDDAVAVVLNVTAVGPTTDTHLTIWPTGATRPNASSLNLPAGDTRANLVTATLGADGTVSVFNNAGFTNVIVDVVGYHTVDGDRLVPLDPARLLDSRLPTSSPSPWTAKESRTVAVRGQGGVPDDATGVFLNVTAVGPTAGTHLTVWPTGAERPLASSLNLGASQTRPNLVFSGIGADGTVSVFNNAGTVNVVIDVVGYTVPAEAPDAGAGASTGGAFIGVRPTRVLDSRAGIGFSTPWGPKAERTVLVAGTNGIPAEATSVVLNLTAVAPSAATHLTVWPSGGTRPTASNLNVPAGLTAANLVVAKVGADGRVRIRNNEGSVHVVADVVGYHL